MAHPVANHPVLSKFAPNLVEQVLAHTTATLVVPENSREQTADLILSVMKEKLLSQGLSDELSISYADATKTAVEANIKSLASVAKANGMTVEQLLFIYMQINDATMLNISSALASKGL